MDYNAITAWGTLGAVLAALGLGAYPIWKDHFDRRAVAGNIRVQLLLILSKIEIKCVRRLATADSSFLIERKERDQFAKLQALYPQATLLTRKEQNSVGRVYILVSMGHEQRWRIGREGAKQLENAIEKAQSRLLEMVSGSSKKARLRQAKASIAALLMAAARKQNVRLKGVRWSYQRTQSSPMIWRLLTRRRERQKM